MFNMLPATRLDAAQWKENLRSRTPEYLPDRLSYERNFAANRYAQVWSHFARTAHNLKSVTNFGNEFLDDLRIVHDCRRIDRQGHEGQLDAITLGNHWIDEIVIKGSHFSRGKKLRLPAYRKIEADDHRVLVSLKN